MRQILEIPGYLDLAAALSGAASAGVDSFTGSKETIERAAAGNFGAAIHHPHRGVVLDMIAHFAQRLEHHGHRIRPDQICIMTEAWVADSGAKAMDEYAAYFLYFNNVLWHHGGNPPGQKANPVASGYVASSSHDYVRPENQPRP